MLDVGLNSTVLYRSIVMTGGNKDDERKRFLFFFSASKLHTQVNMKSLYPDNSCHLLYQWSALTAIVVVIKVIIRIIILQINNIL